MPDATANLALPYILPAQAQKHATHNEALLILDVLVQTVVQDRTQTVPPSSPVEGQCHLVAAGATGAWAGQDDHVAAFGNGGWQFVAPRLGWRLWVLDEAGELFFTATGWQTGAERVLRSAMLGVNATPDAVNRLAVSAEATLLNNAGAGHRLKINKATATDTASLLFQSGFSGRAEMGLAGEDDFSIKVSADGSAFSEALLINRSTGRPTAPQGLTVTNGLSVAGGMSVAGSLTAASGMVVTGALTGTAVTQSAAETTSGRLLRVGAGHQQLDSSLYRRGNAVGTATQAAGIPTGALIERGTNANGDYTRLADGTQLCWGAVTITPVANTPTAAPWVFPAAFVGGSVPAITVAAHSSVPGSNVTEVSFSSPTTVGCDAVIFRANTTSTALRLLAVGRWY